jgi:hypothetical protein
MLMARSKSNSDNLRIKAQRGASTLLSELRREALLKGVDAKLTIKSLQFKQLGL